MVAPVVILMLFALLQFVGLLLRQNVLTAAARDGARTASLPTVSATSDVIAAVEDRLSRGGINPKRRDDRSRTGRLGQSGGSATRSP